MLHRIITLKKDKMEWFDELNARKGENITDDKRDLFQIYFRINHYDMKKKILRTYQNNLFLVFYLDDVIISH